MRSENKNKTFSFKEKNVWSQKLPISAAGAFIRHWLNVGGLWTMNWFYPRVYLEELDFVFDFFYSKVFTKAIKDLWWSLTLVAWPGCKHRRNSPVVRQCNAVKGLGLTSCYKVINQSYKSAQHSLSRGHWIK